MEDNPDPVYKRWLAGAVAPLFFLVDALRGFILKTAVIYGKHSSVVVTGAEAVAVSLCYLALAIFLHVYFFWENVDKLEGYREILASICLICFLAGMGYFVYLDFRV